MNMKKGDNIKVKSGIFDPDLKKFDMSGWQGRITNIDTEDGGKFIEIEWDSITLCQMPKEFIKNSIEEECEYSIMWLGEDDLELANQRDSNTDVEKQIEKLDKQYGQGCYDEQEKRIAIILPEDDNSVTEENQAIYYAHLEKNLQKPIILTGMEDFPWEEKYLLGGWSKKEYEELKKTQPSYTDKFEFIKLTDHIDEMYGIIVEVKRTTDKKKFMLPLWDLKCVDRMSKNYDLISDYSFWMTNYR